MKLTISYNPYLLETSFLIDGESAADRSWAKYLYRLRLQTWFYSAPNWNGLAAELEKSLNESEVEVEFEGRALDYRDLELYFTDWNQQKGRRTTFRLLPQKSFLCEEQNILQMLDELVATFQDSPVETMRDPEILRKYEQARSADFDIAVIATMSSGKSTLINALLGQDLLPTANDATTAKISRIRDVDGVDGFSVSCKNKDEDLIYEETAATPELLQEYNKDKEVFYVDIEGDIPGISNQELRLNLIDTPGPNNSATEEHRNVTYSIINDTERQPIILYILDATKPEDESDAWLLQSIADKIKEGGQQAQDRFIFVMNKADEVVEKNDGTIDDIIRRRQQYLNRRGIGMAQIIPISARTAKLLRMGDTITDDDDFDNLLIGRNKARRKQFDQAAMLSPSCREKLKHIKQEAQEKGDQYTLDLIATGIVGLELTINEYLEKYAFPYKINRIVDTFNRRLREEWAQKKYVEHIAQGEAVRKQAEEQLKEAYGKRNELEGQKRELEQLTDGVRYDPKTLESLQKDLFNKLSWCLDPYRGIEELPPEQIRPFLNNVRGSQKKALETAQGRIRGRLKQQLKEDFDPVYDKCRQLLGQIKDIQIMDIRFDDLEEVCNMESVLESMSKQDMDMMHDNSILFEKTHTEKYKKKNPARVGFLGFFKVWKPWEVDDVIRVSEGTFVNVEKLFSRLNDETSRGLQSQFSKIASEVQQIYKYEKERCQANLTRLDALISEKLMNIQQITQDLVENKIDLDLNMRCKEWIEQTEGNLSALTQFQQVLTSHDA